MGMKTLAACVALIAVSSAHAASPKKALVISEDARRHFIMAQTLQKKAKDPSAFVVAADEYREALTLAPDWPEALYDLALAEQAAGRHDGAIAALKAYLKTGPSKKDAREAQDRIYAIEAEKKIAATPATKPAVPATPTVDFEGSWQVVGEERPGNPQFVFKRDGAGWKIMDWAKEPFRIVSVEPRVIKAEHDSWAATDHYDFTLSSDGRIDVSRYTTQSPAQFSGFQRKQPGARLTDLNTRHSFSMRRE